MRKKIILKGPILTRSGYGEQTRFALRALRAREDIFDIYIQPITWGQTSWLNEHNEERSWVDKTIEKTIAYVQQGGQFDISLQETIPPEWERIAKIKIGYTAGIETTRVAHQWIQKANEMDKIIVVSGHSRQVFENSKYQGVDQRTNTPVALELTRPIESVNYPVKEYDQLPDLELDLEHDYNFLAIAQFGPRKNLPNTIKWFLEEFHDDEVGLVIKSNIAKNCLMDRERLFEDMKSYVTKFPDKKCKIYLLHGDMTDEEIHSLYVHPKMKAFLALPHGEGFGLPIFEAAYSGLPVVATGWSGQLDFLVDVNGKEHFYNVAFDLQQVQEEVVWDGVLIKESLWAFPREQSAKEKMRQCYEDNSNTKSLEYAENIKERFSEQKLYEHFISAMGFKGLDLEADYVFVSDMFAQQFTGGAELSLQTLINSCPPGKRCEIINSANLTADIVDNNTDAVWIFGNIAHLDNTLMQHIIDKGLTYHFVEYDYKYCEYRNPTLYKFLEEEECDYLATEKGQLIQKFINNSANTFFMSQGQMDIYKKHLTGADSTKMVVLSSTFEDDFFDKIDNLKESATDALRDKWIVLGSRSWVKGSQQSEDWCKQQNMDYEVVSDLTHDEMLKKLSEAKGICFKPTGLDTCPRFVIEAKLLGCELELNENVQHLSEDWFDTEDLNVTYEYLKNRKEFFWGHVG